MLDNDDTVGGLYLAFRARRHWQTFFVRSRLLRNPSRDHEVSHTGTDVTAAGGADTVLSAGLQPDDLQIEPVAAVSFAGWTLWNVLDYSRVKDVRTAFRKRGHSTGATLGLERELGRMVVAGTSISYAQTRQTTLFNGGRSRIHGLTVTPYVSFTPTEWLNLTVAGGYVYNRERLRWLSAGAMAKGKRHSHGYTLAAMVETSRWFDTLLLTARTGLSASRDSWKSFVDSMGVQQPAMRERVVQWTAQAEAALWLDPVMPYLGVSYTRDLEKPAQETDRDDVTVSGGLSWYGRDAYRNVSADLSGTVILGRKSQRNFSFSLGLRISF